MKVPPWPLNASGDALPEELATRLWLEPVTGAVLRRQDAWLLGVRVSPSVF